MLVVLMAKRTSRKPGKRSKSKKTKTQVTRAPSPGIPPASSTITKEAEIPAMSGSLYEHISLIVLAVLSLVFVVSLNLTPIYTNDFWLHLKVGDMIRETGDIPDTVLFTFTEAKDNELFAHEWLPALILSFLYSHIGYSGMVGFKCFLAVAVFFLAFRLSFYVSRDSSISLFLAALCMLTINFRTHMRPEIFALVYFLIHLNLMQAFLRTRDFRWLLGLLPLSVLWANSHGSFLVNLGLPLLFLLGVALNDWWTARTKNRKIESDQIKRVYLPLMIVNALIAALSFLNPYGIRLLIHSFSLSQDLYIKQNIIEWFPMFHPFIRRYFYFKLYLFFCAVLLFSLIIGRKNFNFIFTPLLVVFGYLSVDANRNAAWFAIVGTYVMAYCFTGVLKTGRKGVFFKACLALALVVGITLVFQKGNVRGMKAGFQRGTPMTAGALNFIRKAGIQGNVMNSYKYGSELVYHFYPKLRVTIDCRVDAYGAEYYRQFRKISGQKWELLGEPEELLSFLQKYDVKTIVTTYGEFLNWKYKGHVKELAKDGWKLVYRDRRTRILTKDA